MKLRKAGIWIVLLAALCCTGLLVGSVAGLGREPNSSPTAAKPTAVGLAISPQAPKPEPLPTLASPAMTSQATQQIVQPAGAASDVTISAGGQQTSWPSTGPHPFLTALCKFADVPDEPKPAQFFQRLLGDWYPGLDHYWREASYGEISLAGSTVATAWLTLPGARAAYVTATGEPDYLKLAQDCARLGGLDRTPERYYGLNLVFNAGVTAPHAGRICLDPAGQAHCYGVVWTWPPWLDNQATWAHETGHALGLRHTGRSGGRAYSDIWDVMSESGSCELDAEFGPVAQHPIAFHKDQLGWIPAARQVWASPDGETSFQIAALAKEPARSGTYLLARVPIDASKRHFYTLEARVRTGYDANLLDEAVVVHEVDLDAAEGPAAILRWQGAPQSDPAGALFVDSAHGISVAVLARLADGFLVTVRTGLPVSQAALVAAEMQIDPAYLQEEAGAGTSTEARRSASRPFSRYSLISGPDGREHVLVIGNDMDGSEAIGYTSRRTREPWEQPTVLQTGLDHDTVSEPVLALHDGTLYAAWSQQVADTWRIRFAMLPAGAMKWTRPVSISPLNAQEARAPALVVGSRGQVFVLWRSRYACGPSRFVTDVMLRERDATGAWQRVERVDAGPTAAPVDQIWLALDHSDRVYVEWSQFGMDGLHSYVGLRADDAESLPWRVGRKTRGLAAR